MPGPPISLEVSISGVKIYACYYNCVRCPQWAAAHNPVILGTANGNSSNWTVTDLDRLLSSWGLQRALVFTQSLIWQRIRAYTHTTDVLIALQFITDHKDEQQPITISGERLRHAQWEIVSAAVACVHAVHTMVESVAQLINATLLPKPKSEGSVSMKAIRVDLEELIPKSQLTCKIDELLESQEFRYYHAFRIKIKHRSLGPFNLYVGENVSDSQALSDVKFDGFSYGPRQYRSLPAYEVVTDYKEGILDLSM